MNSFSKLLSLKGKEKIDDNENKESDLNSHPLDLNSTVVNIAQIENNLINWTIPRQDVHTIYKIGTFDFMQSYSIKTTEQTIPILRETQSIQLLSRRAIREHISKSYKYIHIGLIQVAVKPLFRIGIGAPVLMCLRDARHTNFENSILAIIESNVHKGPVYYNCYLNFTASLTDNNLMDMLTLNIKTKNLEFKEGSQPLAVLYRIYYKIYDYHYRA